MLRFQKAGIFVRRQRPILLDRRVQHTGAVAAEQAILDAADLKAVVKIKKAQRPFFFAKLLDHRLDVKQELRRVRQPLFAKRLIPLRAVQADLRISPHAQCRQALVPSLQDGRGLRIQLLQPGDTGGKTVVCQTPPFRQKSPVGF